MLSVETTGLSWFQFLWLLAVETVQFVERSVFQRGEEGAFVGAVSHQQSGVRNRFVFYVWRLAAVSVKCVCHPKVCCFYSMCYFLLYYNYFIRNSKIIFWNYTVLSYRQPFDYYLIVFPFQGRVIHYDLHTMRYIKYTFDINLLREWDQEE